MFWKNKNVLVTGGAGFIGSHVVDKLIDFGANVTIADNLSTGSLKNIYEVWSKHGLCFDSNQKKKELVADNHRFIRVDLEQKRETQKVMKDQEIVIHLAAEIGGRGYIDTHPADCCRNFSINHNVIEQAYRAGVDRVHYASTACIYPVSLQSEYGSMYLLKEEDALQNGYANCDGEYGWSKYMGELELTAFRKQYDLKGSIARYVTVYGDRENDTHAIIALIKRAVEKKDPYIVWGSGAQDRDFTYVDDIVDGTLRATERISDGTAINLGTTVRHRIKDVAFKILELTGHHPKKIIFDETQPTGVLSRALNIAKAKQRLGWEPKISLDEGLRNTINWYQTYYRNM